MMILGAFHVLRFILYRDTRKEIACLLPGGKDVFQFIGNVKYYLGLSKSKVDFDRYSYIEKAEYWAVVWGTVIMGLTGLVLWFPVFFTSIAPAWIIKASETLHYYEAILATLAILVYHMFFAIFHPEDYPINLTFLTGKMKKEEVEDRFKGWHDEIAKEDHSESKTN